MRHQLHARCAGVQKIYRKRTELLTVLLLQSNVIINFDLCVRISYVAKICTFHFYDLDDMREASQE